MQYALPIILIGWAILIIFPGCTKFVEVPPPQTRIINTTVFDEDATALGAMTGVYAKMMEYYFGFSSGGVTLYTGLSSDELVDYSINPTQNEFFTNSLTPSNSDISSLWAQAYYFLYAANSVLDGADKSTKLSDRVKKQIRGEAKFIRGFLHFYLTNLWGDVPLVLSKDYRINAVLPRTKITDVYTQIVADVTEAQMLLNETDLSDDRTRPSIDASTALLARVYLYLEDWERAEQEATKLINKTNVYQLEADLNLVFKKNSHETIWQLMPVSSGYNTWEGSGFIIEGIPTLAALNPSMVDSFELNDQRKSAWIGSYSDGLNNWYYPYKYKVKTGFEVEECNVVFRLAEQYLIRAESRARQNKSSQAAEDLNVIRFRAGLQSHSAADNESLLNAINHENLIEYLAEWGHRFLDLKRNKHINKVLEASKYPVWQATDQLYPIPQEQISNVPATMQNPGY